MRGTLALIGWVFVADVGTTEWLLFLLIFFLSL